MPHDSPAAGGDQPAIDWAEAVASYCGSGAKKKPRTMPGLSRTVEVREGSVPSDDRGRPNGS